MNRHTTVKFLSCSQGKSVTDTRTHTHTDGTTEALQYPLRKALRGDNNQILANSYVKSKTKQWCR